MVLRGTEEVAVDEGKFSTRTGLGGRVVPRLLRSRVKRVTARDLIPRLISLNYLH
jgi:hypothetical protein